MWLKRWLLQFHYAGKHRTQIHTLVKAISRAQAQEQFIMSGGGSIRDHTQLYTIKWTHVQGLPFIYLRIFQSFRCVNIFKAEINASALKIRGQKFNWCSTAAFVSCTIKESNWKKSENSCVNYGTWMPEYLSEEMPPLCLWNCIYLNELARYADTSGFCVEGSLWVCVLMRSISPWIIADVIWGIAFSKK
jgi:hypothetical protein